MRNKDGHSLLQLLRVAGLACLYALIGMNPAAAQLPPAPSAAGGTPPCEVNAAAAASAQAFPCGVIISGTGLSSRELSSRARGAGAQIRFEYRLIAAVAATVPNRSTLNALAASGVTLIPDRRMTAIAKPSKGGGGPAPQVVPEGVKRIGASGLSVTGSGVGVAIVDTGLDFSHADLSVEPAPACFDAFNGNCQDQNGHGTHVGGIVAAKNNDIDVVGIAPGVALYAVRVLDASGSGSDSTVMAGLDWIGDNTATIKVANMSLGRPGTADDNPDLHKMVTELKGQGVTIVVAAGNDANSTISNQVPAAYGEVLAIASTTAIDGTSSCRFGEIIKADTASYFTTDGGGVAVSAPGEDRENITRGCFISSSGILSLKRGGGTTRMSGTSMASPHVAGVVALLVSQGITDPAAVRARLQCSADRYGKAPLDSPSGGYSFDGLREGIVSASRALAGTGCP